MLMAYGLQGIMNLIRPNWVDTVAKLISQSRTLAEPGIHAVLDCVCLADASASVSLRNGTMMPVIRRTRQD